MPIYRVQGIPLTVATSVRGTLRSPQYGHPAHAEVATGYGPCRLCLRTFHVGQEKRLLFTYQPFADPTALPAPGPVFIHHEPCERYDAPPQPLGRQSAREPSSNRTSHGRTQSEVDCVPPRHVTGCDEDQHADDVDGK